MYNPFDVPFRGDHATRALYQFCISTSIFIIIILKSSEEKKKGIGGGFLLGQKLPTVEAKPKSSHWRVDPGHQLAQCGFTRTDGRTRARQKVIIFHRQH